MDLIHSVNEVIDGLLWGVRRRRNGPRFRVVEERNSNMNDERIYYPRVERGKACQRSIHQFNSYSMNTESAHLTSLFLRLPNNL